MKNILGLKFFLFLLSLVLFFVTSILGQQKFGLGCLPEPKGAFSGISKYKYKPCQIKNSSPCCRQFDIVLFPSHKKSGGPGILFGLGNDLLLSWLFATNG